MVLNYNKSLYEYYLKGKTRNSVQSTHSMDYVDTGGLSWHHDKQSRVISQDDDEVYIVQNPQKRNQKGNMPTPLDIARASKDSF